MKHTQYCKNQFERYERTLKQYKKKWPNHCRKCNGWGGIWSQYDPSPAGVALSPGYMLEFEECVYCLYEGTCPRCGETSTLIELDVEDGDTVQCPECGWHSDPNCQDMSQMWGLPSPPECHCELEQEMETMYNGN